MKTPNWQQAREFVDRIAGRADPAMTFQVFDDKTERRYLAAWKHGKLTDPEVRRWLQEKQNSGCGVYVVVNECDGKGRRRKNVVAARAVFIDLDGEPLPDVWPVEPDIINETSPGKYHCFWLVNRLRDLNRFSDAQARLAAFYSADPRVFDPPRVVRLPGFWHLKGTPVRSRTLKICGMDRAAEFERHELESIEAAHDVEYHRPAARAEEGRSEEPMGGWDSPADVERARAFLKTVKTPAIGDRNNAGYRAAAVLNDLGISPELSVDLLEEVWNKRLSNPLKEHEIQHVVKSAGRYKASSAGSKSFATMIDEDFSDDDVPEVVEKTEEFDFEGPADEPAKPEQPPEKAQEFDFEGPRKTIRREIGGLSYSFGHEIVAEPLTWLWEGRIPRGKVTLIAGFPDQGKSQIMLKIAALCTTGGEWPNAEGNAPHGVAIILSSEDDEADTLIPRLAAAGADLKNIVIVRSMVKEIVEGKKSRRVLNIEDDLAKINSIIRDLHKAGRPVRMIGIDPINAYFGGGRKADSHKNSDMRALLTPITEWAARLKISVVAISHFNKGSNAHVLYRVTDSTAITAAARAVYFAVKKETNDKDADPVRLFLPGKHNLAPDAIKGLRYDIQSADVSAITGVPNPPHGTPYIEFGGEDSTSAEEAMGGENKPGRKPDALNEAIEFLTTELKDGPVAANALSKSAKGAGISDGTLRNAKAVLRIESVKLAQFEGGWAWKLPDPDLSDLPDGDADEVADEDAFG